VTNNNTITGNQILKISWISLLATGIGILGFGITVVVFPPISVHDEEGNFQNECKNSTIMPKDGTTIVLFPGYLERPCGRFRG
jgi:hypothetical protein